MQDDSSPDTTFPLVSLLQAVFDEAGASEWEVRPDEFWTRVTPVGHEWPVQGWKLHVSATPLSAPIVLVRAARVLVRHGAAFKFAGTLERVAELVSTRVARGSGGKFVTVYPSDDEQFRVLAQELHEATLDLSGPGILSDRRYRPGSIVFYRYGAFTGTNVLTNDGTYENVLVGPDGEHTKDRRDPWFTPPAWVTSPFPTQPDSADAPVAPPSVLLADRYLVREAIQHANKGGVFRATDQRTGAEVVIKQARAHVAATLNGKDMRDGLRREAEALDALAPLGLTPARIDLLAENHDLYLVQEFLDAVVLREWITQRAGATGGIGLPLAEAVVLGRKLIDLVAAVHAQGFVLRDLTPNNVMVDPAGELRLIDVELLARPGEWVARGYTPGFAAPEQSAGPMFGPAPARTADLYAVGATILMMLTGTSTHVAVDRPEPRPAADRLALLIDTMAGGERALRALRPLVLGLTAQEPADRWDLATARAFLDDTPVVGPEHSDGRQRISDTDRDRLITDGLAFLVHTMRPDAPALWPGLGFGANADPRAVQHGAGGVLAVLTAAARGDRTLRPAVDTASAWLATALERKPEGTSTLLPGLYFGLSGSTWALHDAARLLDDDQRAGQARDLALQIPVEWPNPDICHGAAGAGMAQLHLWQTTGADEFGDRVVRCADALLAAAGRDGDDLFWTIPRDFRSELAGATHYGFAHGIAGIGAFLLGAYRATGREDYLAAAVAGGRTLAAAAVVEQGDARWVGDRDPARSGPTATLWCNGSSGIGTFLIRLWQETGEDRFRELAEQAALAVYRTRWQMSTVACHGLAGNGEFLLDMADALDSELYRGWAQELAGCIYARNVLRDGRILVADESQEDVAAGYNTGLAGVLGFLLRLRDGGPRMWMPAAQRRVTVPAAARPLRVDTLVVAS